MYIHTYLVYAELINLSFVVGLDYEVGADQVSSSIA